MVEEESIAKLSQLEKVVKELLPFERVWCPELQADITMFETGYSITHFKEDEVAASYFVPHAPMVEIKTQDFKVVTSKILANKQCESHRYSVYLFGQLWSIVYAEHSELEYDLSFNLMDAAYEDYCLSKYNNPSLDEYQCMLTYLKDTKE